MKKEEIIKFLETRLLEEGFTIHKYEAFSTCSVYLKLDYGASNSIRISDHKGYDHLSYKYEINEKYKNCGWYKDNKDFWRFRCTTNKRDIENLISIIIQDRAYKKCFSKYDKMIEYYKQKSINAKGFWQGCKQVL